MSNLPFGFDKPEDSPGFLLWQTTMIWQRQIKKALEQYNVSHAQFVIIATLSCGLRLMDMIRLKSLSLTGLSLIR